MSQAGWYPDPGGEPGRLRWYDGQQWTTQTRADNSAGVGGPEPGGPPGPQKRRPIWPWLVLALVAVVAGAIIIATVVTPDKPRDITDNPPTLDSTITPWDDSSPSDTPTPTPTEPSSTPPPTAPSTPPPVVDCPRSPRAGERADHPEDGRIHGGQLSFAPAPDPWYGRAGLLQQVMFFGYDVDGQALDVTGSWFSQLTVGALDPEDGFSEPHASAEAILSCLASSSFFSGFQGRTDVHSKQVSISGHDGWSVRGEVRVNDYGDVEGSVLEVIVVDTGDGLSFFVGEATLGHQDQYTTLDETIASLAVD
ncbi:MAG TPA: DUF2510 domain-containing protein [Candidatus Avipropionibacterium avicola]|uniref:DUF2510 domain-containing protein n=1 Tax=Candidatus Avipropionibacterium avicola TaxID=2840701 RepID=A0A9D1GZU0_9ACTN|nr:DUF2510 domain-containing protein [Candidatus Avipropionibacterium avicola]